MPSFVPSKAVSQEFPLFQMGGSGENSGTPRREGKPCFLLQPWNLGEQMALGVQRVGSTGKRKTAQP